jgi:hypothetical protein
VAGKGNPKTGGRAKGTANKDKADLLQQIRDHIGDQDWHPVLAMAEMAVDEDLPQDTRTAMVKEVAHYVSPQLKAIEHTAADDAFGLTLHMNLGAAKKANGSDS